MRNGSTALVLLLHLLKSTEKRTVYPLHNSFYKATGMASIIIHGDINTVNDPIKSVLYVRPVMKFLSEYGADKELIPENMLTVDLIHRAVKEIFDDERLKRTIKVINISLGDRAQPFHNSVKSHMD